MRKNIRNTEDISESLSLNIYILAFPERQHNVNIIESAI